MAKGFKFKFKFKQEFKRIERANAQATRNYLFRSGGLYRTHVRRFVLGRRYAPYRRKKSGKGFKGKKPSAAGQPPVPRKARGRADIKRVKFDVNKNLGIVIIGPTGGVSDAPEKLEKGGMVRRQAGPKGRRVMTRFRLAKRPYMKVTDKKLRPILKKIYAEESLKVYNRRKDKP